MTPNCSEGSYWPRSRCSHNASLLQFFEPTMPRPSKPVKISAFSLDDPAGSFVKVCAILNLILIRCEFNG